MTSLSSPLKIPATGIEFVTPEVAHCFSDEWYELATTDHFWMEWRFLVLKQLLAKHGFSTALPLRVLDIGGGTGVLRSQIESQTNWTVDCADLSLDALSTIKPGRGRNLYYDIFKEHPNLIGKYDAVMLFDVIEHVENPVDFIATAAKHLKPKGTLFVNVPAYQSLYSRYDKLIGHLRRYHKQTLSGAVEQAGVSVSGVYYWGMSMIPLLLARKLLLAISETNTIKRGFAPPNPLVHWILKSIMRLELALGFAPPAGTSVMLIGKRL